MTYMDRVLHAVHDPEWQAFRVSMKGKPTQVKLDMLKGYWQHNHDSRVREFNVMCVYCIRVDNYLKALCRGGQLFAGSDLTHALRNNWNILVKR